MQRNDYSTKQATGIDARTALGVTGHTTRQGAASYDKSHWQGAPITGSNLFKLIKEQDYRCALTGQKLTPKNASLDHIVPLKDEGANDMSNVQIVLAEVNAAKGCLDLDRFIRICREVTDYAMEWYRGS